MCASTKNKTKSKSCLIWRRSSAWSRLSREAEEPPSQGRWTRRTASQFLPKARGQPGSAWKFSSLQLERRSPRETHGHQHSQTEECSGQKKELGPRAAAREAGVCGAPLLQIWRGLPASTDVTGRKNTEEKRALASWGPGSRSNRKTCFQQSRKWICPCKHTEHPSAQSKTRKWWGGEGRLNQGRVIYSPSSKWL